MTHETRATLAALAVDLGAFALCLAVSLALASCKPIQSPPVDADADSPEACAPACANLRKLECLEGQPNARGTTCEQLCQRDQAREIASMLRPDCVADAGSREALHACGVRCLSR